MSGDGDVASSRLNVRTKSILITAVYYPPCSRIGAKRASKIAEFLSTCGWDVTVLTVPPEYTPPVDLEYEANANVRIIRSKSLLPLIAAQNRFGSSQTLPKYTSVNMSAPRQINEWTGKPFFRSLLYPFKSLARICVSRIQEIDKWTEWRSSAIRAAGKLDRKFDIVLSTVPPFSTAILGARLAELFACKYVIDYRDPWSEMLEKQADQSRCSRARYRRNLKAENDCINKADLILTVSPGISDMLRHRTQSDILTIPQGFSGRVSRATVARNPAYLLYAGNLDYGRSLTPILAAIGKYNEFDSRQLKLIYCGPESELALEQARAVGASNLVDTKGFQPEKEVQAFARRAIANIVIVSPGYEYSYPGKLFDLIASGRPIFVVSNRECEAGKLVEKYHLGFSCTKESGFEMQQQIDSASNRNFQPSPEIEELRVENLYRKMVQDGFMRLLER